METDKAKKQTPQIESDILSKSPLKRNFQIVQLSLRIVVSLFTTTAVILTLVSAQSRSLGFGFSFQARYSYSSALRFKVAADVVVGVFSLLSLFLVYAFTRSTWNTNYFFYIFLHDLDSLLLITSGCTAGTSIGFVAIYGEERIGWSSIRNNVTKFCEKIMLSIIFSYLALTCLLILTISSVSKLKYQDHKHDGGINFPVNDVLLFVLFFYFMQ